MTAGNVKAPEYVRIRGLRYRVIAERPCGCGCGERMPVSTKNPNQRFLNAAHIPAWFRRARSQKGRVIGQRRRRERLFGRMLNRAIESGTVNRTNLLALLGEVYRLGYQAAGTAKWRERKDAA